MKQRNNVFTATLVALAFAPVAGAMPRPEGGPAYLADSKRVNANRDDGAKFGKPDNIRWPFLEA